MVLIFTNNPSTLVKIYGHLTWWEEEEGEAQRMEAEEEVFYHFSCFGTECKRKFPEMIEIAK